MRYQYQVIAATQAQQRLRYQRSDADRAALSTRRAVTPAVLSTFDLEKNGDRVRLIETDGSVYEGSTLATNRSWFEVSGTNRASGKAFTVEGEFASELVSPNPGGGALTGRF